MYQKLPAFLDNPACLPPIEMAVNIARDPYSPWWLRAGAVRKNPAHTAKKVGFINLMKMALKG